MVMSYAGENGRQERVGSAMLVLLLHAGAALVLLNSLGVQAVTSVGQDILKSFDVTSPSPPPAIAIEAEKAADEEGATSASNTKKKAVPVEAPKAIIPPQKPRVVAPKAGKGRESDVGAAQPGPGTGGGGTGTGTGNGTSGSGAGGGGAGGNGGGIASRARLIGGRMTNKDYPKSASRAKEGGTVATRFTVGADGRAHNCRITASSGNADIDATTCRLIEQRFRYEPARNRAGEAISDVAGWKQTWWLERGTRVIQRPEDDLPKPPPIYVPPPERR